MFARNMDESSRKRASGRLGDIAPPEPSCAIMRRLPDRRLATGRRKVRLYASRMLESRKSRVSLPFRARDVIADFDLTRETRERRIMRTTRFGSNSKDGSHSRRDLIRGAALGGGAAAVLGGMGVNPLIR